MMDEKRLKQEYTELKRQAAPNLWARIEGNLKDHPERVSTDKEAEVIRRLPDKKRRKTPFYGMAAAAAAILVLAVTVPQLDRMGSSKSAAPAGLLPTEAAPVIHEMEIMREAPDQLRKTAWQPLQVPEQAVTVPEDSQYFSEGILGDTELLCAATVISAELETDHSGKAVKVVYELAVDQVYYAEDYTTGMDMITVKSPIIKTDGDEAYVLYQLLPESTYLLPLKKQDGDWELLYPFAPQIQVTGDGAYLFHSGYASLVTEDTSVVIGIQEGENDYYYDRMLLREDDNFLSDFVSLVEHQTQGRKKK